MKTLYVSDLDGTLLGSNQQTSDYTNKIINELVEKGMLFSYATARSYQTSHKVTAGLNARIPLITYNGAFIIENDTEKVLLSNFFDNGFADMLNELIEADIYPIVYSYIDNEEKFSYIYNKSGDAVKEFVATREKDKRDHPVTSIKELYSGSPFYITCIDIPQKLEAFYEKYKNYYHCVYSLDIYSKEQWLEIMPPAATKANAVLQLKNMLQCDRVVAFGDGKNDMDMFKAADECYAVANAVDELKKISTAVIGSNQDDAVAKWLLKNAK